MDFVKREAQNVIDEEQYKAYIESVSTWNFQKKNCNKDKFVEPKTSFYVHELWHLNRLRILGSSLCSE